MGGIGKAAGYSRLVLIRSPAPKTRPALTPATTSSGLAMAPIVSVRPGSAAPSAASLICCCSRSSMAKFRASSARQLCLSRSLSRSPTTSTAWLAATATTACQRGAASTTKMAALRYRGGIKLRGGELWQQWPEDGGRYPRQHQRDGEWHRGEYRWIEPRGEAMSKSVAPDKGRSSCGSSRLPRPSALRHDPGQKSI
jgi:hypothetical protein